MWLGYAKLNALSEKSNDACNWACDGVQFHGRKSVDIAFNLWIIDDGKNKIRLIILLEIEQFKSKKMPACDFSYCNRHCNATSWN